MSHNILITSAGKRVVLVKIFQKTLKELGLDGKVYTVDMRPEMAPAGFVSEECIRVPRCTSPDYVDTLLRICQEKQIAIVVPTIDTELYVLAQNKARFEAQGVHLVISDAEFIKVCCDKRLTDSLFEDLGIAIPKHLDKDHASFPMFAKPYDGSLSVNTHVIKSEEELTPDILEELFPYVQKVVNKYHTPLLWMHTISE